VGHGLCLILDIMVLLLSPSVLAFLLVGLPDGGSFFQETRGIRDFQIRALFR
jgi:hypothetical protein